MLLHAQTDAPLTECVLKVLVSILAKVSIDINHLATEDDVIGLRGSTYDNKSLDFLSLPVPLQDSCAGRLEWWL